MSVLVRQTPPQRLAPLGHWQVPDTHTSPPVQLTLSQEPPFAPPALPLMPPAPPAPPPAPPALLFVPPLAPPPAALDVPALPLVPPLLELDPPAPPPPVVEPPLPLGTCAEGLQPTSVKAKAKPAIL
jgi:putative membrane protein